MAWSLCELILVGIWPTNSYLTLPWVTWLFFSGMTLTYSKFRDLLSLCKLLLHLALVFWWRKLEFAPALLKQVCCAVSRVPWLRGRQCRRQCAGQDERSWDNVSIVQYPVSLKLIYVCSSGVLCIMNSCDSVCFGSVLFAKSGRLRNRWLVKPVWLVFSSPECSGVEWKWASSDIDLLTCKRFAVSRQYVWIDVEQIIPL